MNLTDRLTRVLLGGTLAAGALLTPGGPAGAQPGPDDLTPPTTDPCVVDGCVPPEPEPEGECPPFVATCDDVTADPCEPTAEDCSPDPDPCADPADCPDPGEEPDPDPDPDPEPYDPPVDARPTFTG